MKKNYFLSVAVFLFLQIQLYSQPITQVTGFGTNPGALNMYVYVPPGISGAAPLVVAMHGCTETANMYATQTGWNKLANLHKFYVVYPEQVSANNSSLCFNWFDTTDVNRNVGEALSIKQMVDYMKANYSIVDSSVFVTGLSAGAAMTTVMIAAYPDVFNKGAIMAGLPYKAATSASTALNAMNGFVTMTPAQWGALVKAQNPTFKGAYPKVMITQGLSDFTVSPTNATELIKQWTYLNHADQTVDSTNNSFQGNANVALTIYNDSNKNPVVYCYKITGMPHGIAVDTGSCPRQGGATGTYAIMEPGFHSTYWAADFFKLIPNPYSITGSISVALSATGITYSVPNTSGSTYTWTAPAGAIIVSGQGTNSITVNFGTHSGYISVTETTKAGCKNDPANLYVNVGVSTGIAEVTEVEVKMYYNSSENSIHTENIPAAAFKTLHIYNLLGQDCTPTFSVQGNTLFLQKKLSNSIYIISLQDAVKQYSGKIAVF
ncbi:MAG TPA: PHB depolymerase family esterase [Bacteroidia bacterium]|jgi:poly(hydroxyalkanoate) depolymerase family esterase|nr:PHB depolymerase family esterase [Bacteroidia bacterium]